MGYAPGPLFKKIMKTVLDARLDADVQSQEEEMAFVRKMFRM
jgi:hypothetical protein